MSKNLKNRTPLPKGAKLTINGITIVNDSDKSEVLQGSSCLVYHGHIENNQTEGLISQDVIIKELYPVGSAMTRDLTTGLLSGNANEKSYRQFMQGLIMQKNLATSEAMEISIKPLLEGKIGDSYYIISDISRGKDLKINPPTSLSDKLTVAICLFEAMKILHECGHYMMLDIKPENFLWIQSPSLIRIIDTDSLFEYGQSKKDQNRLLLINSKYLAPELKQLALFYETEDYEEIDELLSPLADLYSISKYLYELFWNQTYTVKSLDDPDGLIQKLYQLHPNENQNKIYELGLQLIDIFRKALIDDLIHRQLHGYQSASEMMLDFNEAYLGFTSKNYVRKQEVEEVPQMDIVDFNVDSALNEKFKDLFSPSKAKSLEPSPLKKKMNEIKKRNFIKQMTEKNPPEKSELEKSVSHKRVDKNFTYVDSPDVKTLVYHVQYKADPKYLVGYFSFKKLEWTENILDNGNISRTFYIEKALDTDEPLVLLHINPEKNDVYINMGLFCNDVVKLSLNPQYTKLQLLPTGNPNEKWLQADVDFHTEIIDLDTGEPVSREFYYDNKENVLKAKIKMSTDKRYFAFQITPTDGKGLYRKLTSLEIGTYYLCGDYNFPKDSYRAAQYFEEDGSPEALYQIAQIFKTDPEFMDEDLYKEYLDMAIEQGYKHP